jgi:cell division septation protein DedD
MERISLHLPADHGGAQAQEGALSETNLSDEATWLELEEDEGQLEDFPFRGIWVGIVSAVVTFTLVLMVPYWLGWWNSQSTHSIRQGSAPFPSIVSSPVPNTPSSAATLTPPPTELASGPKAAVSAPGDRVAVSAGPTASTISKPVPTSSGGGFWVQIAAFKDANQAVRLATRMRRQGYPADVRPSDSTANPWVVRVGKYPTRERAEAVRAALKKKGFRGFLL